MKSVSSLVMVLVVVGALNWGLVGLLGLDLVESLLGKGSMLTRVVYVLVGVSGAWLAWTEWMTSPKKKK